MDGRRVEIIEVGPRDGLQNEPQPLPTAAKAEMIERAITAGVRRIEATSFVNPRRVPALADAEDLMGLVPRRAGVSYIGLAFNQRGLDRALAAQIHELNFVVVSTETFSRRNQGMSVAETLRTWHELAGQARAAGLRVSLTLAAAFGCPFEGEVDPKRVAGLVEQALDTRPDEIALADTIGVGVPSQVTELVGLVRQAAPDVPLRCHFHNTRNTGYANAVAAVTEGVQALDASMGGLGGCPFAPGATGNLATEDLTYLLHRMGLTTGLSLPTLVHNAEWLATQLNRPVPGLLYRAGDFPPGEAR
jgi:hydroxymethylglutaryl-CoA lyase